MRNLNKAIAIICLTAVMICIGYSIKAKAADIPSAPEVLQNNGVGTLTGIANAYISLTSEQRTIAAYLIGAFNNIYLMARGFSYNIPANETSWKAQFIALGNRVWHYVTTNYGWKSRFNETFRQYLSSVCVYASGISTTFEAWYQANTGTGELYIPYSVDAFSAWTEFYNDPSGDGIASFGDIISEWNSGYSYDFAFSGLPWRSTNDSDLYNNFILSHNPIVFTNTVNNRYQAVVYPFVNNKLADTFYLVRTNSNLYYSGAFGYYDTNNLQPFNNVDWSGVLVNNNNGYLQSNSIQVQTRNIVNNTNGLNIVEFINMAFQSTPLQILNYDFGFVNWYPFIEHVVLVDDLNTLSNPIEIYNTETLNIEAPDPTHEPYILAPNDRLLFPTRPVGYDDPLGFWDIVIDNSVDENGEYASVDDFHQQIVNNTTINNYYVTNDERINVPVEWFENDLTDQLANDSIPFLTFARDCIDTLGDLQIYLYGAVVFGLGGGILKKFLL